MTAGLSAIEILGRDRLALLDEFLERSGSTKLQFGEVFRWAYGEETPSQTIFGDVDPEQLREVVNKRFGAFKPVGGWDGPKSAESLLVRVHFGGDIEPHWIIPGTLCAGDRVMLTGSKGAGKSTLSLQIGVQVASGIHPWTGEAMSPLRVLYIDCENPEGECEERLQRLLETAGSRMAPGHFRYRSTDSRAWDLGNRDQFELLQSWTEELETDLLIIGPLYKLNAGNSKDESVDRRLSDNFDRLRERCAIIIEAHTTKSQNSLEPAGSDVWTRWLEYGFHLAPTGAFTPFRPPRRKGLWPTKLERSDTWPWVQAGTRESPAKSESDSCPDFASVVLEFLTSRQGQEVTKTNLPPMLRLAGIKCRDKSISEALESLVQRGDIERRQENRATYYSCRKVRDSGAF
jgi:hypothetical protein